MIIANVKVDSNVDKEVWLATFVGAPSMDMDPMDGGSTNVENPYWTIGLIGLNCNVVCANEGKTCAEQYLQSSIQILTVYAKPDMLSRNGRDWTLH